LDSALTAFRANGFTATRIEDIAKGAGLSKGAIYLYFGSKETMLKALVERAVLPMAEQIEALAANAAQFEALPTIHLVLQIAIEKLRNPNVAAIPLLILSEAGRFPDLVVFYRQNIVERVMDALAGLLRKGMKEGIFRADLNPDFAVRTLMGGVLVQVLWQEVLAPKDSPRNQLQDQLTHHLDLFIRGISK